MHTTLSALPKLQTLWNALQRHKHDIARSVKLQLQVLLNSILVRLLVDSSGAAHVVLFLLGYAVP